MDADNSSNNSNSTYKIVCMHKSNNNNNNNENNHENILDTKPSNKIDSLTRQDAKNSDFSPINDSTTQMNDEYSVSEEDGASENNSTDNISSVSEDIIENVILLPNSFLSDDESTNSDDVVYAYRGADFEPIQMNGDDETDYLEMDFEPESTSEIDQITNHSLLPGSSVNFNLNSFNTISDAMSNQSNHLQVNLNSLERKENSHSDDNIIIHWTNNNELEAQMNPIEKQSNNKSLAAKPNANIIFSVKSDDLVISPYYDNTVSLSTKKYTGTIPKTNKLHNRQRSKTTAPDVIVNGNGLARLESHGTESTHSSSELHWSQQQSERQQQINQNHQVENFTSSSYCDRNLSTVIHSSDNIKYNTAIVFPNEDFLLDQRISTNAKNNTCTKLPSRREMEIDETLSVTFDSTYCTVDIIIKALNKIHVLPNLRALQMALRPDIDESKVSQMQLPEYLEYASKRYCNYNTIITAIEQSCDDVDVQYFPHPETFPSEIVHIPFRMIAARLSNESLDSILKIKNKRFHQMNVLGKIVNVIRKFPSMRPDLIQNESISIPQFYRSGVICISKKKSSLNQI